MSTVDTEGETMQIQLDGLALQELVTALEAAEGDEARAAVDKRIVKRGADIVKPEMTRRIPRAADHKKSGSAWFKPSGGPAADNVPKENPKKNGEGYAAKVGWELDDSSEYFYMKFVNWGTLKMPPRDFVEPTADVVEPQLQRIAEEEYQAELDKRLGRFT